MVINMKRSIVIYYSLTGNTKNAADNIAKQLDTTSIRICPERDIPQSGGACFMIGGMQSTFGMKPKIQSLDVDVSKYDEIILGTPIWAGKCASPINTLLSNEAIREKICGVFTLSGGGDNEKCMAVLQKKISHLKYSVALADKHNNLAEENHDKMNHFVEEIINGER